MQLTLSTELWPVITNNLTFDPPTPLPELTQNWIRSSHGLWWSLHTFLKISCKSVQPFSRRPNVADKDINKQRNRSKTKPRPPTGSGVMRVAAVLLCLLVISLHSQTACTKLSLFCRHQCKNGCCCNLKYGFLKSNFLLPSLSNFVSKMHSFRDTTTYWSKIAEKTYPTLIWHVSLGWPFANFSTTHTFQKLDSWGYQAVYISRSCFRCARHNTGMWRTDVRTDRQTRRCRKDRASIASRD